MYMKRTLLVLLTLCLLLSICGCAKTEPNAKPGEESSAPAVTTVKTAEPTTTVPTTTKTPTKKLSDYTVKRTGTTTDILNVRSDAGTDSQIVGKLQKGNSVTIAGEKDGFYRIRYDWEMEGYGYNRYAYVSKDYVKEEKIPAEKQLVKNKVSESVRYTDTYDQTKVGEYVIQFPMLTVDSANAKAFNEKINKAYQPYLVKAKQESPDTYFAEVSYEVFPYNSVVAIVVSHRDGKPYTDMVTNGWEAYYYDVDRDKELSFEEYLSAIGTTYDDVAAALTHQGGIQLEPGETIVPYNPNLAKETPEDGKYKVSIVGAAEDGEYLNILYIRYGAFFGGYSQNMIVQGSLFNRM